jgi:multicomponent Na+:H+ antiporter subunit E
VTRRQRLLRATVVVWLVVVWLLLWGTFSAANVISGLAVALFITFLLALPTVPVQGRPRPLAVLWLLVNVNWWLVRSSVQMAWLTLRPGPPPLAAILPARLNLKSDLVLALAVNILNLTPGTLVLEIDQVRRLAYVHVLGMDSPGAVDRFHKQVSDLEQLLVAAFERDSDWRSVDHDFGEGAQR